jgi:hypothetical protein
MNNTTNAGTIPWQQTGELRATQLPAATFGQLMAEIKDLNQKYNYDPVLNAVRNKQPLMASTDEFLPEVCVALDLPYYFTPKIGADVCGGRKDAAQIIDAANGLGLDGMTCDLHKVGMYLLQTGKLPVPTLILTGNAPCDGCATVGEMMLNYKPWANLPRFSLDCPYSKDPESMAYIARQMKAAVAFLQEATGRTLDMDRLKKVYEESNKQCQLMFDIQELRRSKPCPLDWPWGMNTWRVGRQIMCGNPIGTDWLQRLYALALQQVRNKKGVEGVTEKIRYTWFDAAPVFGNIVFPRLEKDLGAVYVVDLYGFTPPLTPIDTTNLDTICGSLAQRYMVETPMTRSAMSTSDVYCNDIVRLVREFSLDAVVMPGHVGHKDQSASREIVKETCRNIGVPFFFLGCDCFDARPMPPDKVYDKMSTFFEVLG